LRKSALVVLLVWLAGFGLAASVSTRPGKKTTGSSGKTASAKTAKPAPIKRTNTSSKKPVTSKRRGKKRVPSWRQGQQTPTPERYQEIQQALVAKGYLEGPATGDWGANSAEALRRFQQDQHLDATGKLDSLSLIALGLGPKRAASEPAGQQALP
jgi:peptidoglycan hydrolase-like protein with peptidoglycan-binding domain